MNTDFSTVLKELGTRYQALISSYDIRISSLPDRLKKLKQAYLAPSPQPSRPPQPPKPPQPSAVSSHTAVIPDKEYVMMLNEKLPSLTGKLGMMEYHACQRILAEILKKNDYHDAEDIIFQTHAMIEKYIYGSDGKIAIEKWKYLENYIREAGYQPIQVNAGDPISSCKTLFERVVPAEGGTSGTIKQVQLMPYRLFFLQDDDEPEELLLKGKCTFYR